MTRLRRPVPDRDRVVILDADGTADIATVVDADDQAIYADSATQEYAIPVQDAQKSYVGPSGRIYLLAADSDYISDTKRLAALEKSIVLRHVTQFDKPRDQPGGIKIKEILLYVMIAVLLLAVILKK